MCVCLSGKCTLAKRLIGSGCCLGRVASGIGRGMGVLDGLDGSGDRRRGRISFGGKCGRHFVTNGDFVA